MKEPIYIFDAIWEKKSVLIDRKHSFYDAWAETWESAVGAFQTPDCVFIKINWTIHGD